MKSSLATVLFRFALLFALLPLAPAVRAQSTAYHCVLYTSNAGKSVRFSSAPILTSVDVATLNAAWKQFVVSSNHVTDTQAYGGCQPLAGTAAQQETVVTAAEANYTRLGAQVVHVNWTSAPGQIASASAAAAAPTHPVTAAGAPPPPATPARPVPPAPVATPAPTPTVAAPPPSATPTTASAAGGSFIMCATSGGPGRDTYLTGVFQTTRLRRMPNGGYFVDQAILDDFYAYLKQKGYTFQPGSNYGCAVKPTEAEARADEQKRQSGCSNCGKIVETGWKE